MELKNKVLNAIRCIEESITKYNDVFGEKARLIITEENLSTAEKMEIELNDIAKEGRLLNIGIIGRVKAGKSSLLNSLFFEGEDILPKAATPMTAALTFLTYGEKAQGIVNLFSDEDIEELKQIHMHYRETWDKKYQQERESAVRRMKEKSKHEVDKISEKEVKDIAKVEDMAKKNADRLMNDHFNRPAYEQYELMKNKRESIPRSDNNQILVQGESLEQLMNSLEDYVGANGSMMPFTKSVEIQLPNEILKDISVVDTPGINDPVLSREVRTKEYLGQCDVVFIVSPSGQFLTSQDTNLIDRIGNKEGVQELFLVASQSDTQLHGDKLKKNSARLPGALESIHMELATHVVETFSNIKKEYPEVGTLYDPFIMEAENRFLLTSGHCFSLFKNFEKKDQWDETLNHVWSQLNDNYPDYFSDDVSAKQYLETLGNMNGLHEKLNYVRNEKVRIQKQRVEDSVQKSREKTERVKALLINEVQDRIKLIKKTKDKELIKQKNDLENQISKGSRAVDVEFNDLLFSFKMKLNSDVKKRVKNLFTDSTEKVNSQVFEITGTKKEEKSGIIATLARFLDVGGYEYRKYSITQIKAGPVLNELKRLTVNLESDVEDIFKESLGEWKQNIRKVIVRPLREAVGDDSIDIYQLRSAIQKMINQIRIPEFSYFSEGKQKKTSNFRGKEETMIGGLLLKKTLMPSNLWGKSGTLEDDDADEFLNQAEEYIITIKKKFHRDLKDFLEDISLNLTQTSPSQLLFDNLKVDINELEKQIKDKKLTLDRLNGFLSSIEQISIA